MDYEEKTAHLTLEPHPTAHTSRVPSHEHLRQELVFLEFFAGTGNTWRCMRADSVSAVGIDINYWDSSNGSENAFDILTCQGLAFHG